MRRIDQLLLEYGESHQNHTNKIIHWICVPLIFFSIVGLIWSIPGQFVEAILGDSPYANWATLALIFVLAYYASLSLPLMIGMAIFSLICLYFAKVIDIQVPIPLWILSIIIFFLAWVGQFYGHKVEGKKPSFLKDIQFLLIGPAWLMHFIYRKLGIPY